jgi:hypothetical protein
MHISKVKQLVSNLLEIRAIRLHRSRIGWRVAPRYTRYLNRCRREMPMSSNPTPVIADAIGAFARDGIASFWTEESGAIARAIATRLVEREKRGECVWGPVSGDGYENYAGDPWLDFPQFEQLFRGDLGDFLIAYFKCPFKILYGTLYRTRHVDGPRGSQLWHSDSGPGICVNVIYYLHDANPANGALEGVPWDIAYSLFGTEKRLGRNGGLGKFAGDRRDRLCRFYESEIDARYRSSIVRPTGPAGLIVPFLNNTIHRGGYPTPGHTRTALVFHCYPSHRPTDFDRYRTIGIKKTIPYPKDPAAEF